MSDESKVPSGEPAKSSSGAEPEINAKPSPSGAESKKSKTVEYETYHKSLQQEKSLRARLHDAEEKLKLAEQSKLAAEGKKDELIEFLKKENSEIKEKHTKAEAQRVHEKVSSQIGSSAKDLGCVDVDLVKQLVDVSTLDIGADAQVNKDSMSLALDKLKREKPYLFSGNKSIVVDAPPVNNPKGIISGDVNYNSLNSDQQRKALETELSKFL